MDAPLIALAAVLLSGSAGWLLGTRRWRARRDAARAPDERYHLAATAVEGILYEVDFRSGHVQHSVGLFEVLGFRPEEVPAGAQWWEERIHQDDRAVFRGKLARLRPGTPAKVTYRMQHRDGRWLHVEDRAVLQADADGKPLRLVGCAMDVTEAVLAEHRLQESEERFRRLADDAPVLIWIGDVNVGNTYANRTLLHAVGLTELAQFSGAGYEPYIHADDLDISRRLYLDAAQRRQPFDMQNRLRTAPSGEYRWHLWRGTPWYSSGNFAGYMGIGVDIHDRKLAEDRLQQQERQLRLMADSAPVLIAHCDADARYKFVNRPYAARFGMTPQDVIGRRVPEVVGEEAYAAFAGYMQRTLAGESVNFEVEIPYRQGGRQCMHCAYVPEHDETGRVVGLVAAISDVSDRRRMEDELRRIAAELSEADRRKDEFLATLAHELRNPLAPLRNGLRLMQLATDGEQVERARSMMERQLAQMVRLVDDLMDVTRISRGKLQLDTQRITLAAVLHSAVETSRPLIEELGHELRVSLPPQPIVLEADLTRLAQAVANLLNNAAKYSERGGCIRLIVEQHGDEATISVQDDGIGIPADKLESIFDMFSQVDGSLERSQGGLGLGLNIVRRLVEKHHGRIEARSAGPGLGSEFIVHLPVAGGALPAGEAPLPELAAPDRRLRILIVDDNRDGADSLALMLGLGGADVRTAYDADEGLRAAESLRPELILLDIGLPGLNGYEACARIRKQGWGRRVFIVAVTGWGQPGDRRRSQQAGFDRHLVKPVDPRELAELMAEVAATHGVRAPALAG